MTRVSNFLQAWQRHRRLQYRTLNRVELSRAAMLHNVALIQAQHPAFRVIPVLKSNAYGHGLKQIAEILNDTDCDLLAVDGYFEAAQIRHITRHRILVLGYIDPANVRLLDAKRCSFVIQDEAGLRAFGSLRHKVRVHLELNTGMNRLGLGEQELAAYLATLQRYPNLELEGVMSHLADADNSADDALTQQQVGLFDQTVARILSAGFAPKYIHIAQTAGSTKAASEYANALRLGIGLYGISPLALRDTKAKMLNDLRPVLALKSAIIKVIDLKPGDIVGYNATFQANMPMRIGVLPVGYYEGVPRALSNCGVVTAGKNTLPIIGRVSMNHTMVDLGKSTLRVGDEVAVISSDPAQPNAVARIAAEHDLFAYGLLTGIAATTRRVIV